MTLGERITVEFLALIMPMSANFYAFGEVQ